MPANIPSPEDEQEALLQFLYLCPVGLIQLDPTGTVEMMNPLAIQLLMPLAPSGDVGNLLTLLTPLAPELPAMVGGFRDDLAGTICSDHRIQIAASPRRGGDPTVLSLTLLQIFPGRLMAVLRDISAQVAQERRIRQNEAWFAAIFNGVNDYAIYMLDSDGAIESWNRPAERMTGFSTANMLGTLARLAGVSETGSSLVQQLALARRNGWHLEEGWFERADGSRFWCNTLLSVLDVPEEVDPGFCVVMRDMTERRQSLDEMRRLTTTDQLTGAYNRYQFFDLAASEQARWTRYGHELSAIMLDADHFKSVNDTHGHATGDRVLRHIANLCRGELRELDMLARLGGEEFAILLPTTAEASAALVAERLRANLAGSIVPLDSGDSLTVTASFGVGSLGPHIRTIEELLKAADQALYAAKRTGRNKVVVFGDGGHHGLITAADSPAAA